MATILVTGSMPFAGLTDSPASLLLPEIDGMAFGPHRVTAVPTRVSLAEVPGNIARLIAEHRPAAFVALGLAPGEPVLRVETTAINRLDFGVADNFGQRPTDGRPIDADGPPAPTCAAAHAASSACSSFKTRRADATLTPATDAS